MEILETEEQLALPPPSSLTVAVAVSGSKKSRLVLRWALDKFISEGATLFKLLHVRSVITKVPTPMGNSIPISQVRDDVAAAYRKEVEWNANNMLLPFKKMCSQRKVQVDVVMVEADDVAKAISGEVANLTIKKLVIGASSHGMFTRKSKAHILSTRISECTPSFCTVYVVSKGKFSSVRPSTSETNVSMKPESSETSSSTYSCSSYASSFKSETGSAASYSNFNSPSLCVQRFQALSTINQTFFDAKPDPTDSIHSRGTSIDIKDREDALSSYSRNTDIQYGRSRSSGTDLQSWNSNGASTSDVQTDSSLPQSQVDINFELERLRIELRHARGMYAMAQNETIDTSQKLKALSNRRMEEANKLKEVTSKEEEAMELAKQEKEKHEAAKKQTEFLRECAERESLQRKELEAKANREAREKQNLQKVLVGPDEQYKKFTWEDILSATSSFSENLKIGMGAYGTVYKCNLHHTTAAVKVLHSKENHRTKQFQRELEILSTIHHPHLLLLLGACPNHGCLVYEYMENGSLEERLFCKDNTPPIPWFERYRIAWEIASALAFLHSSKPKPIVHRDLKPANILLDNNYVSKIGDVGLCTLIPSANSSISTICKSTGPVGTLCYIDPEYQRTGLVSPKSDVYAFGMVILQLLTAKPPIALTHIVETALGNGHLIDILDPEAGKWPIEETQQLAILGLSCTELRRSDRPDLKTQVLPVLETLKRTADRARDLRPGVQPSPPNHFICPILKDVMDDPYVAADGYTYDRKAIEIWLAKNDKSPMTNLPLPNKNLIPNYTLLSAIIEWKSTKQ
ncbi:PREDICTED: U-box domain-containing protein 35-like [Nelumbo nucifera]|nr:PREDICTED: U-box domain-containing protein 35-like [Nelumbo nucifera]XP_010275385.1 PREDICTED: U-box domain-containing protein 35-like [Nelumbo nucifera]